jgi:acyl-CoA reductase-like NAD-dependent aldehyde dehydrogenase
MLHVPILRAGKSYRSADRIVLSDVSSGEPVAEVSQANPGLIAHDLAGAKARRRKLSERSIADLLAACRRAASIFAEGEVEGQSVDEYLRAQSATTGIPRSLCRANMEKVRFVLDEMERVLGGLTRGLDLGALDQGFGTQDGRTVSYLAQADVLGAVLPSNSPGVHSLWVPAIALKVPLALRPGREEPWTPLRIAQSLLAADVPEEAFSFYPGDHAGATQILLRCERSMMFGDAQTVAPWVGDGRVQVHGPGWSKVIFGADRVDAWESYVDLIVQSIAENGGRSCVNASGVWAPRHGQAIAEAVARRLAAIEARPLDDPEACLAAFPNPQVARRVSAFLDEQLARGGAVDLTAAHRGGERVVEVGGATFLLPTLVWCDDPGHPLAQNELLFPFASVVEVGETELLDRLGPTLVASVITDDPGLRERLLACRQIDRLNLGPVPTCRVSWDQPHEGNLFEHLYRRRAFQSAVA